MNSSDSHTHDYLSFMWRWLSKITTGLSLGLFLIIMLFLLGLVVVGILTFIWLVLWTDA